MAGEHEEVLSRACSELARTMARPGALVEVMECLALQAAETIGVPGVSVVLLDQDGRARAAAATEAPEAGLVAVELELAEGPSLDALAQGTVVFADDLEAEERWTSYVVKARSSGVCSVAAVPLRAGERSTGVLTLMATEPHRWQESEVAAAEVLAGLASGYAAQQSELDRVRRTADQLKEALHSRVDIEQAKGVLVGELGCTVDQAYALLRDHARRNNASLRSVAQAVVHLGLRPPAPGLRPGRSTPTSPPDPRPLSPGLEGG